MLEKLPKAIGRALRGRRSGLEQLVINHIDVGPAANTINVSSPAFHEMGPIPVQYTADGASVSPPLQWSHIPAAATSVVLLVEDPDAPTPQPFVHAIAVDLPAGDGGLPERALSSPNDVGLGIHIGRNSYMQARWLAPDPPTGHGVHRYAFQVFAVSGGKFEDTTPGRDKVIEELEQHAIASGCLIGTYERRAQR
jgi:Raf kinase inhibitor-like YbhB/YbcL family protein